MTGASVLATPKRTVKVVHSPPHPLHFPFGRRPWQSSWSASGLDYHHVVGAVGKLPTNQPTNPLRWSSNLRTTEAIFDRNSGVCGISYCGRTGFKEGGMCWSDSRVK